LSNATNIRLFNHSLDLVIEGDLLHQAGAETAAIHTDPAAIGA
jgi:hypothetical protein